MLTRDTTRCLGARVSGFFCPTSDVSARDEGRSAWQAASSAALESVSIERFSKSRFSGGTSRLSLNAPALSAKVGRSSARLDCLQTRIQHAL